MVQAVKVYNMLPTQGGHSWVHFVEKEGKVVVCKTFRLPEHYKKEVQAFNALRQHQHVIHPLEIQPERHILFPDYSKSHVELFSLIQDRSIGDFECTELAYQLCQAVAHLHEHKVAHLDVKPENCLVTLLPKPDVKLIDFSLSVTNQTYVDPRVGSEAYVAPERHGAQYACPFCMDWWSVGATLFAMFYGTRLVQTTPSAKHGTFDDFKFFAKHGTGSLLSWPKFTVYTYRRPHVDQLWPFLKECLRGEPQLRPSKDTYTVYFGGHVEEPAEPRIKRTRLEDDDLIFAFE